MLYLKPPFHIVRGVAVFPDHANNRAFYFLPAEPHLSMVLDTATGVKVPQIQLLKFRGGAGNGGFLTFQVDLALDDGVMDDIAAELRGLYPGDGPIQLAPVILEGGSVRLIMLGRATDEQGKPMWDTEQQQRFVVRITHPSKPSLYGNNQAIFSVELDQEGVELVENSILHSELMPIGVVYQLDFFALRPAFSVKISADWNRVQTHMEESFTTDVLFASTEIDKVVDKLVETQVVQIDVDSFLPEGEDAGSWVGRRDQAIDQFKDMVLENFFKPSLEPMKEEKDGWDRFTDTAERLALLGATGGWGGVAKFSYVKKDLQRIDQKRASLQMNERVTVKRSIYPQATLKGLGKMLRDAQGQIDAGRFIQEVTLDDPWFEKRKIKAYSLVNFEHDEVDSVNLTLTYDGQPRTIRLSKDQLDGSQEWNSLLDGGKMVRGIPYEYRVTFHDVDSGERPGVVNTGTLTTIGDEFEVSPRSDGLYFIDDIQIGASLLPWDRFPQVAVEVRYNDPVNRIDLAESFLLTQDKPEVTWKRFRLDSTLDRYDLKMTFMAADHRDIVLDWAPTDQERLIVRDPHPQKRTLQVAPAVDWRLVAMILVDLRYVDAANGIDEQQTLTFYDTPTDRNPKAFSVNLADASQRLVSYAATIILKDNRVITIPNSMTTGSTIALRTDMVGHKVVTVTPPDIDFTARGIERVEAQLSYRDNDAGLSFQDRLVFTKPRDIGFFEFDYVSPDHSSYGCLATLVLSNGLVLERDLGSLGLDRLALPAG
ncbi:hypothetical protein [Mesorhizobium sp. M0684]|uniref:hypothetical protein n=1 Tax=unclassified Mesorhizobium TaxID=325217 RepID=UPI003338F2C6